MGLSITCPIEILYHKFPWPFGTSIWHCQRPLLSFDRKTEQTNPVMFSVLVNNNNNSVYLTEIVALTCEY